MQENESGVVKPIVGWRFTLCLREIDVCSNIEGDVLIVYDLGRPKSVTEEDSSFQKSRNREWIPRSNMRFHLS